MCAGVERGVRDARQGRRDGSEENARVLDLDQVDHVIEAPLHERQARARSLVAEADLLLLQLQRGAVEGDGQQLHKFVLEVLCGGGGEGQCGGSAGEARG